MWKWQPSLCQLIALYTQSIARSVSPSQAAKLADEVERARKILENKGMQNDERIDSLDSNIVMATTVAIDSSRKMEEASRKLAMTQVNEVEL